MPKFIKLTDIWSGDLYVNPGFIRSLTKTHALGIDGQEANTYVVYGEEYAVRTTQTVEEIMEMLNGE